MLHSCLRGVFYKMSRECGWRNDQFRTWNEGHSYSDSNLNLPFNHLSFVRGQQCGDVWEFFTKEFTWNQLWQFKEPKTAILDILEALNFDLWENSTFQSVENSQFFTFRHSYFMWNQIWQFLTDQKLQFRLFWTLEALNFDFWENSIFQSV